MKTKGLLYGFAAIVFFVPLFLLCGDAPINPRTLPVINDKLHNQARAENQPFSSVLLDTCVTIDAEADYTASQLTWSVQEQLPTSGVRCQIDPSTRIATFTVLPADSEWNGTETMTFTCTAPGDLKGTGSIALTVRPVNDPPRIILRNLCATTLLCGWFDTLWADTCARDVDNPSSTLDWPGDSIQGGGFKLKKIYNLICTPPPFSVCFSMWTRRWTVLYDDDLMHLCTQTLTDTLQWTVEDDSLDAHTQGLIIKRGTTCP